jgi:hypothetical protein
MTYLPVPLVQTAVSLAGSEVITVFQGGVARATNANALKAFLLGNAAVVVPPVTAPTPVLIESSEGVTVTTVGPQIVDAAHNTYSINGAGQVVTNGLAETVTANVTKIAYHNHQFYQFGNGAWYTRTSPLASYAQTTDPFAITPAPAPAGPVAPSQANAVGYTRLAFSDDFTTQSVANTMSAASGFNWYWSSYAGVIATSDFSVNTGNVSGANGVLTISGNANTNSSLLQTVPYGAHRSDTQPGVWRHAYFEARLKFSPTVMGKGGPAGGWPSFWGNAVQGQPPDPADTNAPTNLIIAECDFFEYYPNGAAGSAGAYINTLHNWQGSATGSNTTHLFSNGTTNRAQDSQQPTDGGWHTYGCLWVGNGTTGTVTFYYDNALVVHQNGVTSFALDVNASPTAGFTAMENDSLIVFLGTASGWPLDVDWVRIWQAPTPAPAAINGVAHTNTLLGAYCGNTAGSIDQFGTWLGRPADLGHVFTGNANASDYVGSVNYVLTNTGWTGKFTISVPLVMVGVTLARAVAGDMDSLWTQAAQSVLSHLPNQAIIYLRTGWEQNLPSSPWTAHGQEATFNSAFQRFVTTFRAADPSHKFRFVWCPTIGADDPTLSYPGDAVVDVIGLDCYTNVAGGEPADPAASWNFHLTRSFGLGWLVTFAAAHGKPACVPEWGIASDGFGTYAKLQYQWCVDNNILYANYWNSNDAYAGKLSDGTYPRTGAEFRHLWNPAGYPTEVV